MLPSLPSVPLSLHSLKSQLLASLLLSVVDRRSFDVFQVSGLQ